MIGEDDVLLREGIVRLLTEAGFDVVAQAGDAHDLLRKGLAHRPSVVIADVNMPPGHGDDGLRAAIELRRQRPETGVLVLSQYYEERYALDLIGDRAEGVGYLLKERVGDLESFIDAVTRVANGGSALDPEVVGRMLGRRQRDRPLDRLSPANTTCWPQWRRASPTTASLKHSWSAKQRSRNTSRASSTSSSSTPPRPSTDGCSPYSPTYATRRPASRGPVQGTGSALSRRSTATSTELL